ncbi:hypothetical protein HH308_21715 [Gordonia sp. TBRC 11910]|uniref:Uncharacterized protein n=1 Tax=Gordonia asplenii TaxID=2725283 RepID=A0A848KZ21_9ACTN|nr:hypothetical protein [Gordonia asplenii]NMO03836.1 hypothetical protein [Gordonia asplenii]
MRKLRLIAITAAVAAGVALPAVAQAAPNLKPLADNTIVFQIPAIGGLEVGPGGVPGGSFQPVSIAAEPAVTTLQYPPPPPAIVFSAVNPAPYYSQYAYRWLSISWHNITTGKTGVVSIRHWRKPAYKVDGYPASLPTSAIAQTGAGTVVATVSVLRDQYQAPPTTISVISGISALVV